MGIWRADGACLDFLGFGRGVWQPIPPFPGLGCASALTPAPFLPSAPLSTLSGCCLEPTRFVQFCSWRGMGVGEGPDLCVCPGKVVLGVGWPSESVWSPFSVWGSRPHGMGMGMCPVASVSPVWRGVSCFIWISLQSVPAPSGPPACSPSPSLSATGASLACSWNLERRRRKRQADRPPTL